MAKIRNFELGTQNIRPHGTEVECFYQVLDVPDGDRMLHLSTFGSDARASKAKSSQSLQIDEDRARLLIKILQSTFPKLV